MNDTSQKPEENVTSTEADSPEGFDKPTGPFANRKTASFADETDSDITNKQEESLSEDDSTSGTSQESDKIKELEAQIAEIKDQALRAMADTENMRKRTERERGDMQKYAITSFAKDLLSVSDNLRRALETVPENSTEENDVLNNLVVGIEATERELLKVFEQKGITKIKPVGEKFNPNFHEVMFEAPSSEYPEGIITQVIESGYILNDRLLRPARVGGSKGAPEEPTEGSDHIVDKEV